MSIQVFSKEWYKKHQKKLVWFANTDRGKGILDIGGDIPDGKRIVRVLPNCFTWLEEVTRKGEPIFTTCFYGNEKIGKRLFYGLNPLWSAFHWLDKILDPYIPQLSFGFNTFGPVYPSAGAVSPCDGLAYRDGINEPFSTLRSGSGAGASYNQVHDGLYLSTQTTPNTFDVLYRLVINFDTSPLAAYVIISATFSLYGQSKVNYLGLSDAHLAFSLVGVTPGSTSTVVASDYDIANWGTTRFAPDITYSSWNVSGYNDFAFNDNGKVYINKTGITSLGGRLAVDLDNGTPNWGSNNWFSYLFYIAADYGSNQPKVVVTYRVPGIMW